VFRFKPAAAAQAARRAVPSLGLAAALLATTLGAPGPALAQAPVIRDHRMGGPPVARVQVIMHSVKIHDDRDGRFAGEGEFDFWYTLVCAKVTDPCLGHDEIFLDGYGKQFGAGSGETYDLKQTTLPVDGTVTQHYDASAATGYPLYPGHNYRLRWGMEERDAVSNPENMGDFRHHMTPENNWGIGTFTTRSVRNDGKPGDFELTYEVRPLTLPDLRPGGITIADLPGSTKKHVCVGIQNVETGQSSPSEVLLRVDGSVPSDARATVPAMAPGTGTQVCIDTELPDSGQHKLEAIVDPGYAIVEYNEANNVLEQSYVPAPKSGGSPKPTAPLDPAASTLPTAGRGEAQADLTVTAITVNGQAPDGKSDCKDGKNTVAIVVKNAGTVKAGGFAVRLDADGDEVSVEAVDGLEAGKEREVRFEEVKLKKGEHTLAATVDSKKTVAESNEENNDRQVTARCQGDN